MILQNRYFKFCLSVIICQQITLAVSTYFIAMAGESLVNHNTLNLKLFIVLFFVSALTAYFLGSCVEWLHVKLKNNLLERYINQVFAKINRDQRLSSTRNQQRTISWLSAEAPSTFDEICGFLVSSISIYCNILFTFAVFGVALGLGITLIMATSLVISTLLVTMLRHRITRLADDMQTNKLSMILTLQTLWNNHLFTNQPLITSVNSKFHDKANKYFIKTEHYTFIEQIVACLPVYIAIPLVTICALKIIGSGSLAIGAFVAVLPRTLQLFGNVHSLSLNNSRFWLIRKKLHNLKGFTDTLESQEFLDQIKAEIIQVNNISKNESLSINDFLQNIIEKKLTQGRFLITGSNGSGKSSLLKLIKSYENEAMLLSPDSNLNKDDRIVSTGESQKIQISNAFSQNTHIFLLDEWDANLDNKNVSELNKEINKISKNSLVVEVRHRDLSNCS